MFDSLFIEIAVIIVGAGLLSMVTYVLRQPLIIAYIATGLIVGPSLLNIASAPELFTAMSEVGIAFLLFLVGLHLNWRSVKDVGAISALAGMGQVIFTSIIGFLIATALGFEIMEALFLSVGFAFSSTIVIVKLLSDKEDLERFYGRLSVGILLVQDIAAMVILILIGAMRDQGADEIGMIVLESTLKVIFVILAAYVVMRWVVPKVMHAVARSQELMFLVSIGWCFAIAGALYFIGFGIEIGALLAGITLAGTDYQREIESKIQPLRDFFLIIFFIVLGTHLSIGSIGEALVPGIIFSLFILIGNPLIVLAILRFFGYHPRTGFLTGVTMAQVSEFSFIVIAGGISAGFISEGVMPLATLVALTTITLSTYLIKYNEQIYHHFRWAFAWLENGRERDDAVCSKKYDVLVFGYHRIGEAILPILHKEQRDYLVVDIDPNVIHELQEKHIPHEYGDAGNEDMLKYLRTHKAKLVVSTIPDSAVNEDLLHYLKHHQFKGVVVVTARTKPEAAQLYEAGANYVIVPNILGGAHFAELLHQKQTRKRSWTAAANKDKQQFNIV
ncbi:MAG: cation:proton antiporter [bacterium]|nr:cation:proton antiporter [bacterium]MDA1024414.1 cation:proton antiporter [bacterium]